jgi:hypothetical protein
MKPTQIEELILQSLEHEQGGLEVYRAALTCAQNSDLEKEWEKNLAETRTYVDALEGLCQAMGFDAGKETAGRLVVRKMGQSLVEAIEIASAMGDPAEAELVACECVVVAETTDHLDWELLTACDDPLQREDFAGERKKACVTIEDQENEQLSHGKAWCRALWRRSFGLEAVLSLRA